MLPAPRRLFALGLLAATATLATVPLACGARSELVFEADEAPPGSPAAAGNVTLDAACQSFAAAYCERLLTCDSLQHSFGVAYGSYAFRDDAQCRERFALACTSVAKLPGAVNVAAPAQACATMLATSACEKLPALALYNWAHLCGFSGNLPAGATCRLDQQCAGGRCTSAGSKCGSCEATLDDGASCGVADKELPCRPGSACRAKVCTRDPKLDERCEPNREACQFGLECRVDTCVSPYPGGDACSPARCRASAGSVCTSRGQCEALEVALTDGGCGNIEGASTPNPTVCLAEHACVNLNDFGRGRCRRRALDGEACEDFGGSTCLFPAACIAGTCRVAASCEIR